MTSNNSITTPYLRTSRSFPEDISQLTVEINRTYLDIATAVNSRTIGVFPTNRNVATGETWFIKSRPQQSIRQTYPFGAIAAGASLSISYKIKGFDQFSRIFGTCVTAQPDSRPIPYASIGVNSNIDVRIDTANSVIIISVGAASPNVTSGLITIEWLSQV